jgi:hypothetical protein
MKIALIGLAALGGVALGTPVSAMPVAPVPVASNVEQAAYVCNQFGRCWYTAPYYGYAPGYSYYGPRYYGYGYRRGWGRRW